jgi:hypothetical protein
MTSLVRIDAFLPYIARRVTIAFGYNNAWRENGTKVFGDTSAIKQYSFTAAPSFQSLRAFSPSPVVILKGDSNASIRVWQKRMKPGERQQVS